MAAPHVAGAAALVLGANPALKPDEVVKAILERTTKDTITGVPRDTPNAFLYTGEV